MAPTPRRALGAVWQWLKRHGRCRHGCHHHLVLGHWEGCGDDGGGGWSRGAWPCLGLPCLALPWLGFDTSDPFPTPTAWGPSPPSPISPLPWPHAPLQRRRRGAWEHADAWVPDESWSAG